MKPDISGPVIAALPVEDGERLRVDIIHIGVDEVETVFVSALFPVGRGSLNDQIERLEKIAASLTP